jgi:hypothetical protein
VISPWAGNDESVKAANARLIAAAPELLDACNAALTDYEACMPGATSMRAILRAAIAKATGGAA